MKFDVVVIGAGPGGYVCAIRCAQLGFNVAIIDKEEKLGGTCLRVGCIPSKALLESSELYNQSKNHFSEHGIQTKYIKLDLKQMLLRKNSIVSELTSGVSLLMKKNKIKSFQGFAELISPHEVIVKNGANEQTLSSKYIVIATGSGPIELPFAPFDHEYIVNSTDALSFQKVPRKMIVIGGGAIGLELGSVWSRLGAEVTIVELLPSIAPFADRLVSRTLMKSLEKQGMSFMTEHKLVQANIKNKNVEILLETKSSEKISLNCDKLLVSVGRKPFHDNLGLDKLNILIKEGRIDVNKKFQTNISSIYAIGDVVKGPMLAHKAEEDGIAVAEILSGMPGHVNYQTVPNIIYTHPELAMIGKTEEDLKKEGKKYKVGKSFFRSNGRAKTIGMTDGFVKILSDEKSDRILGVHIVGSHASDLIAEITIAMEFSASSEDIMRTCHAHPTLSETLKEAALSIDKRSING